MFDQKTSLSYALGTLAALTMCVPVQATDCDVLPRVDSNPVDQLQPLSSWSAQNRFVEISAGQLWQNYVEKDTRRLTPNGVLDSETGRQSLQSLVLRWQAANHWLVNLQAERRGGPTNYNGYLQTRGTLIPYQARTANLAFHYSVELGMAMNHNNVNGIPAGWQFAPVLRLERTRWDRHLTQYSESYSHATQAVGLMVQWRPLPGTLLELHAIKGSSRTADVNVPKLGFEASQPGGSIRQKQLAISQDLQTVSGAGALAGWRVVARYSDTEFGHGESLAVNGLQAPPNVHRTSSWRLGIQRQF